MDGNLSFIIRFLHIVWKRLKGIPFNKCYEAGGLINGQLGYKCYE
jgi:hypothetical protein